MRNILNRLLKDGVFPAMWKRVNLLLIPKPERDPTEECSYRSICLLNAMAKLFKAIILERLENDIKERSPLRERQYDFFNGRSGSRNCHDHKESKQNKWKAIILLDVKNAFNASNWECIVRGPLIRIIYDYFRDRNLRICIGSIRSSARIGNRPVPLEHPVRWCVKSGYTQGSKAHWVRR